MDWIETAKIAGELIGTTAAAYAGRGAFRGAKAFAEMYTKLVELQKDVGALKTDVGDVKSGLAQVRGAFAHYVRIAELKNYLKSVSSSNDADAAHEDKNGEH